jgi:hypothetical protein
MVKVTAGITRRGVRSDGPIDAPSSPARGLQAAGNAVAAAHDAIVRNRPSDLREQTGISRPLQRSAPHDGAITQKSPRLAGNDRPAKSNSFPAGPREK